MRGPRVFTPTAWHSAPWVDAQPSRGGRARGSPTIGTSLDRHRTAYRLAQGGIRQVLRQWRAGFWRAGAGHGVCGCRESVAGELGTPCKDYSLPILLNPGGSSYGCLPILLNPGGSSYSCLPILLNPGGSSYGGSSYGCLPILLNGCGPATAGPATAGPATAGSATPVVCRPCGDGR